MSEFTEFMTMKLIEQKRLQTRGVSSKEAELYLLEQIKAVKNLNVRAPIGMIGMIEVLSDWYMVSKAEMVMEMLQSCINDAVSMLAKEGHHDTFMDDFYAHMEKNYSVSLRRNSEGKVESFVYNSNPDSTGSNDDN